MTDALTTLIITVATWTVGLTAFLVRMAMKIKNIDDQYETRVKMLETQHKDCRARRITQEDALFDKFGSIQDDLSEMRTDIKWIKKAIEKGGGNNET